MSAIKKLRSLIAAVSSFLVLMLLLVAVPANAGTNPSVSQQQPITPLVADRSLPAVGQPAENLQPLATTAIFADVPDGTQFFTEMSWLANQGISTGWPQPDGSKIYGPLLPVKRDAMAAFMYRLAGNPDFTAPASSPFADVFPETQFYKEITWLAGKNISTGWTEPDGTKTYRPLSEVNRDAMAAFMYRFAGSPVYAPRGVPFDDVGSDNQFYIHISWLAGQGISTGWSEPDGGKTYRPLVSVNRDAMAAFMYRFYRVTHPLTITDGNLHDGMAGARYLDEVTATGGIEPLSWTAAGLPEGLSPGSDGTISGIPLTTGTSNVTFTVTDAAGGTASVTRALNVPESLPEACIAKACAVLTPATDTVEVPGAFIAGLERDTTNQAITSVTLSRPSVNGIAIAAGQVLVLAPTPQIESGATVRVNSMSTKADGTITAGVTQVTPADAYDEGVVNSIDPTADQDTQAAPFSVAPPEMTANKVVAECTPGMTNTLTGLAVTPNLTPAMTAKWGFGGLSRYQFDLDGTITINLGIKVSGKGTCNLSFGEFKRLVPAGFTGAIVLAAKPQVAVEFSGSADLNATFTFKCASEYVWTPNRQDRTSRCSTEATQFKTSTDLDVGAKLSAGIDLRVAWNDVAGITGNLAYGVSAELTPARNPGATVYLGATYDVGLCMACMWPASPFNLTIFSGEIPIPRTHAKYQFPGPLVSASTPGPLAIGENYLPGGTAGTAYRATLAVSGGVGPYRWSLASGTLPAGLTLEPTGGIITGIPSSPGTATFTAVVTDNTGEGVSSTFWIAVASAPGAGTGLSNVKAISSFSTYTVAVKTDGTVWAWGSTPGNGSAEPSSVPVQVSGLEGVTSIQAADGGGYALKGDGTVWAWGAGANGRLGNGTNTESLIPVQVSGLTDVVAMTSGGYTGFAVKADGTVWGWGDNYAGQLATGNTNNAWVPVRIQGLTDITGISVAPDGTAPGTTPLALKSDGTVWAWGANAGGQLGDGTGGRAAVPVQVPKLTGVTSILAANHAALALTADGSLWSWGDKLAGLLGDGTSDPVQMTGLGEVSSIALATTGSTPGTTAYARKTDGTVWAWGHNYEGQLGNGTRTDSAVPVQVSGLTGVKSISAGYHAGYALKSDGTVWAWGDGHAGKLGNGTTSLSAVPVRVSGLTGVTSIAAGFSTGYALKGSASVWSWGANGYGILGNGSASDSSVPVQVGP